MSEDKDIKQEKYMSNLINSSKIEDIKGDYLDYFICWEDELLLIQEKIFQGYNFSIDELGNIIKHNHGRTYIQMSRPRVLR